MAYVNVAEWKTEQVCEWLKGVKNRIFFKIRIFIDIFSETNLLFANIIDRKLRMKRLQYTPASLLSLSF